MALLMFIDLRNCFIFISLCFICYSIFFKKPKNGLNLPPSPPSLPIIGHVHLLFFSLPHKAYQKLSFKYGPLILLQVLGLPVLVVSSASMAYEIYRKHDVNISSRGFSANDESLLFGSSSFITCPYGDYVKFMKKLLVTKLLQPNAMEMSRGIRAKELERFYFDILDKATKNERFEIEKEAMRLANNVICRMSMGMSCSKENGESERVRKLVIKSFTVGGNIFMANIIHKPLRKLVMSFFKKKIMEVTNGFDELLERILVEHEEKLLEKHQDKDMMDLLLEAYRDKNAEYKITRNHIKSFFVEVLNGGTNSSAQAIQWTMAEIINNPNVLKRLREEIYLVIGNTRMVQETDLPNLPYLQAVVKEGLRLHPPGTLVPRMFEESCEIKGFHIAAKTKLVVNVYAVNRDPDVWEDPDEFKPERFLASEQEDVVREHAFKYLPFGGGRRGCPASNLGYIVVEMAIGIMVQCFDWSIKGDKVSMEESFEGSVNMAHPLKCIPVVRLDSSTFNLQSPT